MATRRFSSQLVHPVTLISVATETRANLTTVSWITPVSFSPPLFAVAISPKRFSHDLILEAGEFAILVLTDQQREMATLAGTTSGKKVNKWEMEPFKSAKVPASYIRAPLLKDLRCAIECRLTAHYPAGDHTLFIGEAINGTIDEKWEPLILFNRAYHKLGTRIASYP